MPERKEKYKLITGKDDANFCKRVTEFLDNGYELYGSPTMAFNGEYMVVAQAIVKVKPQLV